MQIKKTVQTKQLKRENGKGGSIRAKNFGISLDHRFRGSHVGPSIASKGKFVHNADDRIFWGLGIN